MIKCEYCGREFESNNSLRTHLGFCKYKEHSHRTVSPNYDMERGIFVCECKREFISGRKFASHACTCKEHLISKGIEPHAPSFLGKHHSIETKEKMRISAAKSRESRGINANFSKKACQYMDDLNIKNGWNLVHALNGKEKIVKGYYLDGYDEKNNIVFEYDERKHYIDVENNILRPYDIERQNCIMKILGCRFFRYNEVKDRFYEVNSSIDETFNLIKMHWKEIRMKTREEVHDSMEKLGLTFKSFDVFIDEFPEYRRSYNNQRNKDIREHKAKYSIDMKKRESQYIEISSFIKEIIMRGEISLEHWDRMSQIRKALALRFSTTYTSKQIVTALSHYEPELIAKIFNRPNKGSFNQIWIHNDSTDETKRIYKDHLIEYQNNGWTIGRKSKKHWSMV